MGTHSSTPSILPNFIHTLTQTAIMSLHYLPPVKPSAIALGTFFNHGVELAVLSPLFGATLVGSALQAYGVGALINATGTLSYKGATYLGGLIFAASAAPGLLVQAFSERRPLDTVGVSVLAKLFETVGLSVFLSWWGTRTNPFE